MALVTEEVAKKTNAPVTVKCSQCHREALLEQMLKEEPVPGHHEGAIDVFLLCPHCGYRHHSYYASENLLFKQRGLKNLQEKWQRSRLPKDFTAYRYALEEYNLVYDRIQKRITAFVKKEAAGGRTKK